MPQPLTIAMAGGVPASLGGGGLELQMARTTAALARRGHEVFDVAGAAQRDFDVLHVFSSGPDVAHWASHWRRGTEAPLVLTPVIVVSPVLPELRQTVAHALPLPEFGPRARRELLRSADAVIACSEYEAKLARRFAGRDLRGLHVVGNGADSLPHVALAIDVPEHYLLLVGKVSRRKRQLEAVNAIGAGGGAPVVVGGFDGSAGERERFAAAVDLAGGLWLREIDDQQQIRALMRGARALVHLSAAEGQAQAIVEALSEGTRVIAAPIPSNVELARRYPGHVTLVRSESQLRRLMSSLPPPPATAASVPSWDDVAAQIEDVYHGVTR